MTLLPSSVEKYVAADAPVRAYDVLVEALDFEELGIKVDPNPPRQAIRVTTRGRC